MQPRTGVLLFLTTLSIVSGYLMSRASLVGRVGMSLFYRQYNFLKVWWKGSLLIFIALMVLFLLHSLIQKRFSPRKAKTIQLIICLVAITGLYFTYNDFRHTLSHRFMGERFHLGVYLFWLGWIVIIFFYLLNPGKSAIVIDNSNSRGHEDKSDIEKGDSKPVSK